MERGLDLTRRREASGGGIRRGGRRPVPRSRRHLVATDVQCRRVRKQLRQRGEDGFEERHRGGQPGHEHVVRPTLHADCRGRVVGIAQFRDGDQRGMAVPWNVGLGYQGDAERLGSLHPSADLGAGVRPAVRGRPGTAQRRKRESVATGAADRCERRVGVDVESPRLVVGEVEMDVAELAPRGDVDHPLDDVWLVPAPSEVEVDATECQLWFVVDVQLRRATFGGQELAEGDQAVANSSVATGSHGDGAAGDVEVIGLLGELIDDRQCGRCGVAVGPDRVEDVPPCSSPEFGNRPPHLGNCRGRSDEPSALMALCARTQHDVSGMRRGGHDRCVAGRHHGAVACVIISVGVTGARWTGARWTGARWTGARWIGARCSVLGGLLARLGSTSISMVERSGRITQAASGPSLAWRAGKRDCRPSIRHGEIVHTPRPVGSSTRWPARRSTTRTPLAAVGSSCIVHHSASLDPVGSSIDAPDVDASSRSNVPNHALSALAPARRRYVERRTRGAITRSMPFSRR